MRSSGMRLLSLAGAIKQGPCHGWARPRGALSPKGLSARSRCGRAGPAACAVACAPHGATAARHPGPRPAGGEQGSYRVTVWFVAAPTARTQRTWPPGLIVTDAGVKTLPPDPTPTPPVTESAAELGSTITVPLIPPCVTQR